MIDYCIIAKASIIEIGDAPIQDCHFDELMAVHGYNRIFEFFREKGISLHSIDFRRTVSKKIIHGAYIQNKNNDINNTVEFDLKSLSCFSKLPENQRYGIANYHHHNLNLHHNKDHHKYLVAQSIVDADLVINIPKPKTHRFAGITGAQKNFIGMCADKEYLPHYRYGILSEGGDESNSSSALNKIISAFNQQRCKYIEKKNIVMQLFYISLIGILRRLLNSEQKFIGGQWYGNDTIWRTILDLNLILHYGNKEGIVDTKVLARNVLSIGDMIIAGEKSGPLSPSPKPLGIILASTNCVVFDYIFCKITGSDYKTIPTVKNSLVSPYLLKKPLREIKMYSNLDQYNDISLDNEISFPSDWYFSPHPFWESIIKVKENV
jgi:hypothetical protein